jgi:hypothetical protein
MGVPYLEPETRIFPASTSSIGELEALSEAAAARNRWEFMLTVAPLPVPHGTGSPVNPIAMF